MRGIISYWQTSKIATSGMFSNPQHFSINKNTQALQNHHKQSKKEKMFAERGKPKPREKDD
jgi:hypothetical protein